MRQHLMTAHADKMYVDRYEEVTTTTRLVRRD